MQLTAAAAVVVTNVFVGLNNQDISKQQSVNSKIVQIALLESTSNFGTTSNSKHHDLVNPSSSSLPTSYAIYANFTKFTDYHSQEQVLLDLTLRPTDQCPKSYKSVGELPSSDHTCKKVSLCARMAAIRDITPGRDSIVTGLMYSQNKTYPSQDYPAFFSDMGEVFDSCTGADKGKQLEVAIQRGHLEGPRTMANLTGEDKRALLLRYSPFLTFHSEERYFAFSLMDMINGTRRVFDGTNWNLETIEPIPKDYQSFYAPYWMGSKDAPVNVFWKQQADNVADLIYSYNFPFNEGKKIPIALNTKFGNHVGDLEYSLIRLVDGLPVSLKTQYHSFPSETYYDHPDLVKVGGTDRVKLWSAKGSHGIWTSPGTTRYMSAALGLVQLYDERDDGYMWDAHVVGMEGFDITAKQALPGNTWVKWWPSLFEKGTDGLHDPSFGNNDPLSGPVYLWGSPQTHTCLFGQCVLEGATSGVPYKSFW